MQKHNWNNDTNVIKAGSAGFGHVFKPAITGFSWTTLAQHSSRAARDTTMLPCLYNLENELNSTWNGSNSTAHLIQESNSSCHVSNHVMCNIFDKYIH